MFVGRFSDDVESLPATTSASINVEEMKNDGEIKGPVSGTEGTIVSLPEWSP